MSLHRLLGLQLAHNRQQEDDLVPLVQQEEGVELNLVQDFLVFSHPVHLAIVTDLLSLDAQSLLIRLDGFPHATLEVLLLAVADDPSSVVDDVLLLLELAGVDDDQILLQVQLADVIGDFSLHGQGETEFVPHLVLHVGVDGVLEQFLPAEPVLRVALQHLPDQFLVQFGDAVYLAGKLDVLSQDDTLELDHVAGIEWRLPVKHPIEADTKGVDVGFVAVLLVLQNLWGHVKRGAQHGGG